MKAVIWMPTMIFDFFRVMFLPRWLFLATYKTQSESVRLAEQQVRNTTRIVDYYMKKKMIDDELDD